MTITQALQDVGDEEFVQLTTFRRSGEPVPTPVWVARDGDSLVVTTPATSGKVKRLRHTERVELRPCSRRGKVEPGAPTVTAVGRLETDPAADRRTRPVFLAKYGWQFRVTMALEKVVRRFRPVSGPDRFIIRITDA